MANLQYFDVVLVPGQPVSFRVTLNGAGHRGVASSISNTFSYLDAFGSISVGIKLDASSAGGALVSESGFGYYTALPEPGAAALVGMGLLLIGATGRRRIECDSER